MKEDQFMDNIEKKQNIKLPEEYKQLYQSIFKQLKKESRYKIVETSFATKSRIFFNKRR